MTQDHAVGGDHLAAGGHGDDLAGALEHDALVEDEEGDGEDGVGEGELAAVAVLDDLADGGALAAAIPRGHQPVERRDEHVLPLVPDGGEALAEGRARLRHRLLGVGARAERLADHDPPRQLPVAEKVAAAGAGLARHPQPERRDADEVADQHRPIQRPESGCVMHVAFSLAPGNRSPTDVRQTPLSVRRRTSVFARKVTPVYTFPGRRPRQLRQFCARLKRSRNTRTPHSPLAGGHVAGCCCGGTAAEQTSRVPSTPG